jgi:hypothetical protein
VLDLSLTAERAIILRALWDCYGGRLQMDFYGPNIQKVKEVRFTLEQAMKAQRMSRGIALLFL